MHRMPLLLILAIAALMEAGGDALLRKALLDIAGPARIAWFLAGAAVLAGYGTLLNLAPLEFGQVVGLYIATLFVMWQLINFAVFRSVPNAPILAGGALIVTGGLIVTFWKSA